MKIESTQLSRGIAALLFSFCLCSYTHVLAQTIQIWPKLAPGSENTENNEQWSEGKKSVASVYQPDITPFLLAAQSKATPAILICPGGGYRQVVMEKEGYTIAKWLNENGIAAFVLKYRLKPEEALRDAQRAMSLIRSDAKKYNIDENKIGVIGFSAGGHLAANLVMHHADHDISDAVDGVVARPDFWIGVYGAYFNLYDPNEKPDNAEDLPPAFLVHAGNDSRVPVLSSVNMYTYLKENNVPAELHIYEQGEHGFAMEKDRGVAVTSTVEFWSERCIAWLKLQGIL